VKLNYYVNRRNASHGIAAFSVFIGEVLMLEYFSFDGIACE
jgi:hypothetical protein